MTTPHNRTSTAYDMSLFDTSKRKEQQTPEKKPELKVATSSVAKSGRPVAVAVIGAVFLAVFVMFLYTQRGQSEDKQRNAGVIGRTEHKYRTEQSAERFGFA